MTEPMNDEVPQVGRLPDSNQLAEGQREDLRRMGPDFLLFEIELMRLEGVVKSSELATNEPDGQTP
jgi:hypothetical protein